MANNYTPSYNQYLTHTAGYALPSSVRSYSVFDPSSNSWRRMTNDGRSPMPMTPAQEQAAVAGALMQAQQTQGKVWNPLPVPAQTPAQTPLGGPRIASPASGGGTTVVPMGQGRNVSPKASQGQIPVLPEEGAVQAPSTLYQGMGKTQEGDTVYTPLAVAANPVSVPTVTSKGVVVPTAPFSTPAETVAASVGLPPTNNRVNVADTAFRGLPEGFIKQKPKADTPSFYWDPSERGEMNYNEEMKNLGRAISEDPETASRVGQVWGATALAAAPVGAMVGALGKGAVWGARALAGTKMGKNLAQGYRIVRNNAVERGRQIANYLGDRLYNPQSVGTKGFNKFNFENFTDARVSPSVQAERLAEFQNNLRNTASIGRPLSSSNVASKVVTRTPQQAQKLQEFRDYLVRPSNLNKPLPNNAIRPLRGFENFSFAGF